MSANWVAGSVRARALARRRLGAAGARSLAALGSLSDAVDTLARSPYGLRVGPGDSLAAAQRGVADTLLWHLRVLAGWLPASGATLMRAFAAGFEIANLDEQVRDLTDRPAEMPFRLGSLATAWPVLAQAASLAQLRSGLARSGWGDPGGETPQEFQLVPRLRWAERLAALMEPTRPWVCGAVALLVARELAAGRTLPPAAKPVAFRLIGPAAEAVSLAELTGSLRPVSAWALSNVVGHEDLWRAEARWFRRLSHDGTRLLSKSGFGPERVIGAVAVLAVDAAMVRGALEVAARGGTSLEVLDAMA